MKKLYSALNKNEKIVLEAVKQNGYALKYADNELKKNEKFVLEAVKQIGKALEYADNDEIPDLEKLYEEKKN